MVLIKYIKKCTEYIMSYIKKAMKTIFNIILYFQIQIPMLLLQLIFLSVHIKVQTTQSIILPVFALLLFSKRKLPENNVEAANGEFQNTINYMHFKMCILTRTKIYTITTI